MLNMFSVLFFKGFFVVLCGVVLIACGGSEEELLGVEEVQDDLTAPIISINGDAIVILNQGDEYLDAGAIAVDDTDGSVEVTTTGIVDSNEVGTYIVVYSAVDSSGNSAIKQRTIKVEFVDITAPLITLIGSAEMSIIFGSTFVDPGATVADNVDEKVLVVVEGRVESNNAGQYTLTYSAEDAAGNRASKIRLVEVLTAADTVKPIIKINGEESLSIYEGDTYTDAGATATDNVDGDILVATSGAVNNRIPNIYSITYTAIDKAGNVATKIRRVAVVAKAIDDYEIVGNFLVGQVVVPLGDEVNGSFVLHVQRHKKNGSSWTDEPLVFGDGRDAPTVYSDTKIRFQTFYQDMIDRGMPLSQMQQMLRGITGGGSASGVHIQTGASVCGYSGAPRTISCGPNAGWFTIAHESMHGWQWGAVEDPRNDEVGILFQDVFTMWANFVYHTRESNPDILKGRSAAGNWELDYLNYGLQNDAEWLANVFSGWLYSPTKLNGASWEAMLQSAPEFVEFFDCLWEDGGSPSVCSSEAFGDITIKHPQHRATGGIAAVEGFTDEDSTAIWKVCLGAADSNSYKSHFDEIVKRVAPNLPGSPADNYSLGYGDCNHDGTTDWVCTYTGSGPSGIGNGKYLWNRDNRVGAYTFIAGGNEFDTYAEYKQDPYSTLPSMAGGALSQPWYREWQGEYGSCNGASVFKYRRQDWIDLYLKDIRP